MKKEIYELRSSRTTGDSFSTFFFSEKDACAEAEQAVLHMTNAEKAGSSVSVIGYKVTIPDRFTGSAEALVSGLETGDLACDEYGAFGFTDDSITFERNFI